MSTSEIGDAVRSRLRAAFVFRQRQPDARLLRARYVQTSPADPGHVQSNAGGRRPEEHIGQGDNGQAGRAQAERQQDGKRATERGKPEAGCMPGGRIRRAGPEADQQGNGGAGGDVGDRRNAGKAMVQAGEDKDRRQVSTQENGKVT